MVVALVQRDPRRRVVEEIEPPRQERRFTEPGWCGDERQLQLRSAVQALVQSRTWDQAAAHLGEVDLGLEQQAGHDQSRNAPTVLLKPWIKYRCRTANTTSGGSMASASPAKSKLSSGFLAMRSVTTCWRGAASGASMLAASRRTSFVAVGVDTAGGAAGPTVQA